MSINANKVSSNDVEFSIRNLSNGVAAKSNTTKSASLPTAKLPILSSKRNAFAPPNVAKNNDLNGLNALPCSCNTLYASFIVDNNEKHVPAPTSVPIPTLIPNFSRRGRSNKPEPKNKFDVGQKATAEPVSAKRWHSLSHR